MPSKKLREGVCHATVSSIGTDWFSASFKRIERTNPAEIAVNLVNLCAQQFIVDTDEEKAEHVRRNFLMACGMTLLAMAQPVEKVLDAPMKDTISKWELALNDWEQDDAIRERKGPELLEKLNIDTPAAEPSPSQVMPE
jgi:hypothetical protein